MRYISTRGQAPPVSFLDAMLAGMAPDGGLYVPVSWPTSLDTAEFRARARVLPFNVVATEVLHAFAFGELNPEEAHAVANSVYLRRDGGDNAWPALVAPIKQVFNGRWVMELFHGPSLSFKDVAMQLIAPLYDLALSRRNARLTVVCATSGDTGGAAVEALKRSERVDLFVLTQKGRVSEVQRRFMTTSGAANVFALDVDSDFDGCQAIVKALFADKDFARRASLSGVNSINWARIVAQSVYFHIAANALGFPDFAVPTGNFGDAFSGYVAKKCGAPMGTIILATNANDILVRALETGRYERAAHSVATLSPAMDIQVASNFERILFEALGRDGDAVRTLYAQFAQSGGFDIPEAALARLRTDFAAVAMDDAQTQQSMRDWAMENYVSCPHTAIGLSAFDVLEVGQTAPIVTLATAHPAKFPDTIEAATGVRPQLPARCSDLFQRPEKFDSLPADVEAVKLYIRERSKAWS